MKKNCKNCWYSSTWRRLVKGNIICCFDDKNKNYVVQENTHVCDSWKKRGEKIKI